MKKFLIQIGRWYTANVVVEAQDRNEAWDIASEASFDVDEGDWSWDGEEIEDVREIVE